MTDLTQFMPRDSATVDAIYAYHKKRGDSEPKRGYLGASIIGHECERYLWYCFRQACKPEFSGRLYRLFETGDLEEVRFHKELRAIGCTVYEVDGHGNQWEVNTLSGHISGHMDGAALGIPEAPKTWHVLEFKTHNAKSFTKLKKEGVQKSKPMHYAQMMTYMHLTGMKRALYIARNKNTDELYSERIRYNKDEAQFLMDRARRIITSNTPPERSAPRRDYFSCKWCDAKDVCWGTEAPKAALPVPSLSCRQCCHATPRMDGIARWSCKLHGRSLSPTDQDKCCEGHLVLPGLISFAEPTDYQQYDNSWEHIEFTNTDGSKWLHGNAVNCLSSRDLMVMPANLTADPMLQGAREVFNGMVVTDVQNNVLSRYTDETSTLVWKGKPNEIVGVWAKVFTDDLRTLTPTAKCNNEFYRAAEVDGLRAAFIHTDPDISKPDWAEIRVGKQ
jgi:hypothetical protein